MSVTHCPCGFQAAEIIGTKEGRTIVRCTACRLVRHLELPENYLEQYTRGLEYHVHHQRQVSTTGLDYQQRFDHDYGIAQLRWPKLLRQLRLLDVGCANGAFVAWARDQGMRADGLEINSAMAAFAREKTGCVIHESFTTAGFYDIVTLHDVIEHLEHPVDFLETLRLDHLVETGLVVIDTPDADDPRFANGDAPDAMAWHHVRPNEHLWYFTAESLTRTVYEAGFTLVTHIDRPIPGKLVVYARA